MEPLIVGGLELRYVLTLALLDHQRELTVVELADLLSQDGLAVIGRPSKTISDALRWEVRHGRVRRTGRARYTVDRIPRSTQWWIRKRVESIHTRLSLQRWQIEPCEEEVE